MASKVFVVHCIDTEGPLFESLEATFNRLNEIFGLDLEPTRENLRKIQNGELAEAGDAVEKTMAPELLKYNEHWGKIDAMLEEALSESFRSEDPDSRGGSWIYNWFCVDHVDYKVNPRRRTLGYHEIFDHYRRTLQRTDSSQDGLQFHYHPHNFQKDAHRCATHWWVNSDSLYQILSRRIIDRQWFPAANRPGFHTTRPDSHWFLEQFIPFDFANQSVERSELEQKQRDLSDGRFGDWRRAPRTWTPYQPSHDDYQKRGNCRRWIARCLNVGTRLRLLDESEIRRAFEEAKENKPVVLAFTNHDFRNIRPDVNEVRELLSEISREYRDVKFEYAEAVDAMQRSLGLSVQSPGLKMEWEQYDEGMHRIHVVSEEGIFGPQPYLAIKTVDGDYYHDNFDIQRPFQEWSYTFDVSTLEKEAIDTVGLAANSPSGVTEVLNYTPSSDELTRNIWNQNQ